MKILNNKIYKSVISVCFAFFFLIGSAYSRDSNGVTVTDFATTNVYGMDIDHFSSFNPTSATYIYNEAGETAITSGEVDVKEYVGSKIISISVPTLGSTSIDFRIEGKLKNMPVWFEIYVENVSVATTTAIIIPISEDMTSYRVGVKVNTNGTDVIDCSTHFITKR